MNKFKNIVLYCNRKSHLLIYMSSYGKKVALEKVTNAVIKLISNSPNYSHL